MRRLTTFIVLSVVVAAPLFAGLNVKVSPRVRTVEVDGSAEVTIKRIPEGGEFLLTVNKGQDVSFFQIQWFKNGQPMAGETTQELRKPLASAEMNGEYTVQMSSPCATVMSKSMVVVVEPRDYQVNTQVDAGKPNFSGPPTMHVIGVVPSNDGISEQGVGSSEQGVAGLHETRTPLFTLQECQPNPVTDRATITFVTAQPSQVMLKVVDLNGNVVATLVNDHLPAGTHDVSFNTRDHNMSSSMYYYVLSAPGFTDTKPLLIVK